MLQDDLRDRHRFRVANELFEARSIFRSLDVGLGATIELQRDLCAALFEVGAPDKDQQPGIR
jgi:hypothetical protein